VWIVVVTAGSAIAMAALFSVRGVPPFTLACNFSVLLFLITGLHVARGHLGSLIKPAPPSVDGPAVETALRRTVDTAGSTDPGSVLNAVFRGLGSSSSSTASWAVCSSSSGSRSARGSRRCSRCWDR
jgi:hypothetical protein